MSTRDDYENALRKRYRKLAAVDILDGRGTAYFNQPSEDAFDAFAAQRDTPEEPRAFRVYVQSSFVGACEYDDIGHIARELNWSEVSESEGPAWAITVAGHAVNMLSGSRENGAEKARRL